MLRDVVAIGMAVGLCAWWAGPSFADSCTAQQQARAESAAEHLTDWSRVSMFAKLYGQCDDGGVADGVTESVVRLLADHWDTLPALASLIREQPALRRFVITHVDSTADTDDLQRIRDRAAHRCAHAFSSLCKDIVRAVDEASR